MRQIDALQALENLFDFCEEIDLHLPDEEKTGYRMLPDYLLLYRYINDNEPVRHGHWKEWDGMIPTGYEGKHYCSLCGGHAPFDRGFHERLPEWCCGCGAKMDEEEENETN